jgi:TRAP-type C4-dicarboxylate transport system permease small subunit
MMGGRPADTNPSTSWAAAHPIEVIDQQPIGLEEPEALSSRGRLERIHELSTAAVFTAMLVVVLVGIFWRYVLGTPLVWTVSIGTLCFIWTIFLGSPLSDREDRHIAFDVLYNVLPPSVQFGCRVFGNILIIATFTAIIPATIDYLDFLSPRTVVGADWLSFRWAYSVFLIFLVLTIFHRARLLALDIKDLFVRRQGARR